MVPYGPCHRCSSNGLGVYPHESHRNDQRHRFAERSEVQKGQGDRMWLIALGKKGVLKLQDIFGASVNKQVPKKG